MHAHRVWYPSPFRSRSVSKPTSVILTLVNQGTGNSVFLSSTQHYDLAPAGPNFRRGVRLAQAINDYKLALLGGLTRHVLVVKGKIEWISGPAVKASGMAASKMYEVVEVGEEKLVGEIIDPIP